MEKEKIKVTTTGQYIKDLSFENPQAPKIYTENNIKPKISISIDINVTKLQENIFEVDLIINASADNNSKKVFVIELTYSGIFSIQDNENEEDLKESLFIYCPALLFPYVRRIISDTVRDAAMPPLVLDIVDFRNLYESKKDTLIKK